MKNPIERINDLEDRVSALEKAAPASCKRNRRESAVQSLVRPLDEHCRQLALIAWATIKEGRDSKVTLTEWLNAIYELDGEDRRFPRDSTIGATMRALLAEEAGLNIKWSSKPIRSATHGVAEGA